MMRMPVRPNADDAVAFLDGLECRRELREELAEERELRRAEDERAECRKAEAVLDSLLITGANR